MGGNGNKSLDGLLMVCPSGPPRIEPFDVPVKNPPAPGGCFGGGDPLKRRDEILGGDKPGFSLKAHVGVILRIFAESEGIGFFIFTELRHFGSKIRNDLKRSGVVVVLKERLVHRAENFGSGDIIGLGRIEPADIGYQCLF